MGCLSAEHIAVDDDPIRKGIQWYISIGYATRCTFLIHLGLQVEVD